MKAKIVCMGDSLTEGYGIEKTYRWTDLLENELNMEIVNSGISGDTTGGMLARFKEMVIDYKPTHVIIMGGTNDVSINLPYELIISNVLAMTRYARYNNIEPIIGIPTFKYPNDTVVCDSVFLNQQDFARRVEELRNKLHMYVKEEELLYIDFSINVTENLYLDDGLHPNEAGHRVMMENVKVCLKEQGIF